VNFLLPMAFAALAAIAIPVLLHLRRKTQQQQTDFAALRWLRTSMRPRRLPVLQERWLLALRILLIGALVALLAQPVRMPAPEPLHWHVVLPGLPWPAESLSDSDSGIRRHWLTPGFPEMKNGPAPVTQASVSSLLRELDSTLPAAVALSVWVPSELAGLDAQRIELSRNVHWHVLDAAALPAAALALPPPVLAMDIDSSRLPSARYFRAAYRVWQSQLPERRRQSLPVRSLQPELPQHTIFLYLQPGPVPESLQRWARAGGRLMLSRDTVFAMPNAEVLWWDDEGRPVLHAQVFGKGQVLQWQQTLSAQSLPLLQNSDFPLQLQQRLMVMPGPDRAPADVVAPARRGGAWPLKAQPERTALLVLLAVLFMLERWLATDPKRGLQNA